MDENLDTFISSVLRKNMLIFIEELFRRVLKETEGLDCATEFSGVKPVLPSYEKNIGTTIKQILTVASIDIDQLFERIKEKIQVRENLKIFISRLGDKFLSLSSQHELYFLTITSRIFTLMFKAKILSPHIIIKEVVGTVLEHVSRSLYALAEAKSLPTLNIGSSIADILDYPNWIDECRRLRCGEPSDYFTS